MKDRIDLNSEAVNFRRDLGKDPFSPLDIFSILSNLEEFTIVFHPMSNRISGMCIRDRQTKLIAINSTLSYGRQRYTAAHELYHLYFHIDLNGIICAKDIDSNNDAKEKEANLFASFFLAPYESLDNYIRAHLGKQKNCLGVSDIVKIEQYYGLSRQATLCRLTYDRYLTKEVAATMKTNVVQTAVTLGFDPALYRPAPSDRQYFTLGEYIQLAEELKNKDLISNGKYEEFLLESFRSDIVYGSNSEEESYD